MRTVFLLSLAGLALACGPNMKCKPGEAIFRGEKECKPLNCSADQIVDPTWPHRCIAADVDAGDASIEQDDSAISPADGGTDGAAGETDSSDCAGTIDECGICNGAGQQTWYADRDGDGLGDPNDFTSACAQPSDYVSNSDDAYPTCAREEPPADCTLNALRCTSDDDLTAREQCVADMGHSGCTDWLPTTACGQSAPVCGGDGECGKCTQHSDCSAFGKACDTTTGSCVACTPDTEVELCPDPNPGDSIAAPACDPVAKTCTGRPQGSVSGCGECASDSECAAGNRCVLTKFGTEPHGYFCLKVAPDGLCPNRAAAKKMATSILGVVDEYCFPDEALTTCEAVIGFQEGPCDNDDDCGADGLADALCIDELCTYACDSHRDCSGSNNCIGDLGDQYCNPN